MNVYLDIETLPSMRPDILEQIKADAQAEKDEVKAPSNFKDEEKIAAYISAKHAEIDAGIEQRYRKTALDGTYGQICVIGYAIEDDDPVKIYKQADWKDEAWVLHEFFSDLTMRFDPSDRFTWIGHNIINFDLPFIRKRAVINGIKPPAWFPVNPRPNSEFVYDTMIEWAGWGNRISLDRLGRALQLGDKSNFDGSMVYDAVKAGDIKRVADYCVDDVDLTRAIYKRMTFS